MEIESKTIRNNFRNNVFELLYYVNEAIYEHTRHKDDDRLIKRLKKIMSILSEKGHIYKCDEIYEFTGALESVYSNMQKVSEKTISLTQCARDLILSMAIAYVDGNSISDHYCGIPESIIETFKDEPLNQTVVPGPLTIMHGEHHAA